MPTIRKSLGQIKARKLSTAANARLAKLADKPDAEINFSDQPEITDEAIASGKVCIVGRGGKRPEAGRNGKSQRRSAAAGFS